APPQADAAASEDQPRATPRGTTFLLPGGWTLATEGNATIIAPPEADGSRFVIVDATASDPDEAVAQAWAALERTPKFLLATDASPHDGWEQRRVDSYDVPQNAKRVISAAALRKGDQWTVFLADADQAIAEKRGSQLAKLYQRLQPAGHVRENFAGRSAHKFDAARLQQVADFVERMRRDFEVPGVAVGIIEDGKVVMSRGFGVRRLGDPAPVDGDTRFMIASNTKPLTTLMLAKLVDAGKLD